MEECNSHNASVSFSTRSFHVGSSNQGLPAPGLGLQDQGAGPALRVLGRVQAP